jgi:hypothetical protein
MNIQILLKIHLSENFFVLVAGILLGGTRPSLEPGKGNKPREEYEQEISKTIRRR